MFEPGKELKGFRRAICIAALAALSACGGGRGETSEGVSAAESADNAQAKEEALGVKSGFLRGRSDGTFAVGNQVFSAVPCAKEGTRCIFTGEQNVAYGANGKFNVKRFTGGGASCDNATFGDPIFGVVKSCFLAATVVVAGSTDAGSGTVAPSGPAPGMTTAPAMTISPAVDIFKKLSQQEAARFLIQATYGPNTTEIAKLANMGYGAWVDEQFATAPMDSHWNYIHRMGPIGCNPCTSANENAVMESFWMQAVRGQDQLHQRIVFALSELFVTSAVNSSTEATPTAHAAYLDMLSNNAFGNYRTLLEQVATHPSMGSYLSHLKNDKEDPATGRLPDENFAREVMQLFTIGLWELNEDGSRKKDAGGNDIPTYGQADIMGMAKVFTGLSWGNGDWDAGFSGANPKDPYERVFNLPMKYFAAHHSPSEKRILRGVVIPANTSGEQSMKIALDTLFNHPNAGPFFGSQLIKRLVTSNPSPAYVKRVAQMFNNNGAGVRGDMKAVIRAVLLDPEARDAAKLTDPQWGKLREPMVRYANFMRAFDVKANSGVYLIWNTEDTVSSLGQNPMRAPSVFNWFRPDYSPAGAIAANGLVAPEFQITHETTSTGYANFMAAVAEQQNSWYRDNVAIRYQSVEGHLAGDYSVEMALARDPSALVDRLNQLLIAGQMTASTKKAIVDAVNATPAEANSGQRRVALAVYLILVSPEFIVQK